MNWAALHALRGRNVHVVGLASTECAAMVRLLWAEGVRKLTVHDFQPEENVAAAFRRNHVGMPRPERDAVWAELAALPITRHFGADYLTGIDAADAVFAGQAWYLYAPNLPRLTDLRSRGVPFHGLGELYFDLSPAPILAVTGSNGKSTTSRLAEAILRLTGRTIYYAGNERHSVQCLDRLHGMTAADWLVLEISNRQLIDLDPRPRIGVVTNVLPNHLDEHGGTLEAYAAVKRKLVASQRADDFAVLNADNAVTAGWGDELPGQVYRFSRLGPVARGAWLDDLGHIRLSHGSGAPALDAGPIADARIPGLHNHENILAAACASWLAGAEPEHIARGVAAFRGLRHRIQLVWAANDVVYYDDLNSTTPQATEAALATLPAPIVLIAGGEDKGLDYTALARLVAEKVRRVVLLPGAGSERLAAALADSAAGDGPPIVWRDSLPAAVADVVAHGRPGDQVLLSPACPYFFRQYYLSDGDELGFRSLLRQQTAEPSRAT